MVTADNIDPLLMALRNYGVKRAKFYPDGGVEELEFEPTPSEADAAPQTAEYVSPTTTVALPLVPGKQPVIAGDVIKKPGYAELFRDEVPRFRPDEG